MPDLRLDTTRFRDAARTLGSVADALSRTDSLAEGGADAVGHRGLAEALRTFADDSRRRRTELGRQLEEFAGRLRAAADGFEESEEALAVALTPGTAS